MKKLIVLFCLQLLLTGCNGCSRSSRNNHDDSTRQSRDSHYSKTAGNVIQMKEIGGVYEIPVEINGSKMNFIFDTGASDITISATEARFLYKQGTLTREDILGTQMYQTADGSISEGTVINLRTVKIGNSTLENVKASVVHNSEAPLLFGQSALAQFGKISIDYSRNEIKFE